jgi:hypothetical protein
MTDPAKDAKKARKADAKKEKKRVKADAKRQTHLSATAPSQTPTPTHTDVETDGKTPAIRAAEAAERQVALQKLRVIIALATMLVAAATLIYATRDRNTNIQSDDPTTTDTRPIENGND